MFALDMQSSSVFSKQFSVLMSVYGKENGKNLEKALESILSQTYRPNEIILVKDGPLSDDLEKVIKEYTNQYKYLFKIVALEENIGLGKALKLGLYEVSNEYVARMDSDDVCVLTRFEKQLRFLEKHPEVDVCGMWIEEFLQTPEDLGVIRKVPSKDAEIKRFVFFRNPMNHVTVMFKKSKVMSVGGYEDFSSFEDYNLWFKLIKLRCIFFNIPEVGVWVRVGNDMIGRRIGLKYFFLENRFFLHQYRSNNITFFHYFGNVAIRFFLRILSKNNLMLFYKFFLRN